MSTSDSSSQTASQQTPRYYVPEQSRLPLCASVGLFFLVIGSANWMNGEAVGPKLFGIGALIFAFVLWCWFAQVIDENLNGMNSPQLKRSYVWGMGWFIFSEVMFFAAFFGALFYVRNLALPWMAGEGDGISTHAVLWPEFVQQWPLMTTPDQSANGAEALMQGPDKHMSFSAQPSLWGWLPFWNTVVLLSSSVTIHIAHTALKNDQRKRFQGFLGLTVLLGMIFIALQIEEYYQAYVHMGLTLDSGIYGATFFMLTGFHGAHVVMGTGMLLVMFLRAVLKGHFNRKDHFGFEAASWYWHFVDVVWLGLFIFVYVV